MNKPENGKPEKTEKTNTTGKPEKTNKTDTPPKANYTRDLILGVEFENIDCIRAVEEYEKRGVITFERSVGSMYSKRMVEAFHSKGMIRLSPLHVNTPDDIDRFLDVTQEIAALY